MRTAALGRYRPVVAKAGFSTWQPAMLDTKVGFIHKLPVENILFPDVPWADSGTWRARWQPYVLQACFAVRV